MEAAGVGSIGSGALSTRRAEARPSRVGAASRALAARFAIILAAFLTLFLLSWPIVFSFSLWVFNDRSSLLNLDYLLDDRLRLGVDTFYSYGLLPVGLQHLAFAAFGRGYAPMVGFTVIALVLMALAWAVLFRPLPRALSWWLAALCVTPMLLWINPNFPYSLALLSMLGALACVLQRRLDLALAVAAIGCWSVPSLPLALTAFLLLLVAFEWWTHRPRMLGALLRTLAPGAACYLAIGAALAGLFGWRSVLATALPFQGAAFYATKGYGWASLHEFLSPADAGLRWYLFTRSGWWMASSVMLFGLAGFHLARMLRGGARDGLGTVVVLLALLHAVFVFYAPGPQAQHIVYDPMLAGGVLLGLAGLPRGIVRGGLLALFAALAVLGSSWQARDTWRAWRDQHASAQTAGLYATPDAAASWQRIVDLSARQRVLLLAYPTGVHHYFPTVQSPRIWFLEVGQTLPQDEDRVLAQMQAADIIVTYPLRPYVDRNPRMRDYLASMCSSQTDSTFVVWRRC